MVERLTRRVRPTCWLTRKVGRAVPGEPLARQCGAFGIVTCDSIPVSPVAPAGILAQQCGAFGIVTYDLPPVAETQTTPVPVPYVWLRAHDPDIVDGYEAYEAAAKAMAANGRKVWECYVLGLDPENGDATNDFRIVSFPMKADGTPDIDHIAFDPPQARWNVQGARAVIKGAAALDAADWPEVTEQNKASFRFFKVTVEMP